MRYAGVPDDQSEKVQRYFEYLQQRSHPGTEVVQFLQVRSGDTHRTPRAHEAVASPEPCAEPWHRKCLLRPGSFSVVTLLILASAWRGG